MTQVNDPDRGLEIAPLIRSRRRAAALTQKELADLAGVGKRFIVELEAGKQTVRLDKANQVLRVFGKRLGPTDIESESRHPLQTEE